MKKKLLAMVLSVVMIAALLVPMMAISADADPTVTIYLGDPVAEGSFIKVPVYLSGNTGEMCAIEYKVYSIDKLEPLDVIDNGTMVDSYADKLGRPVEITFGAQGTAQYDPAIFDGYTGYKVLNDSDSPSLDKGIKTEAGLIAEVYFAAPTAVGTYTFRVKGVSAAAFLPGASSKDDVKDYVITNGADVTYTIECKSHIPGTAEETKPATCTEKGEKVTKCTACGAELSKTEIPALDHDWDNGVVAENVKCGDTADTTYTCKRDDCGETKVVTGAVVNHDMVADEENSKPATCTEKGVEAKKCAREGCDHTETKDIDKLGHAMESDQAAGEAPTCTEDGKVVDKCSRCGHIEETVIPKLGHDMIEDEENSKAPTCYAEGVEAKKCSRDDCDYTETKAIPMVDHSFLGDVVVITAPTAEAEGKYTRACVNDGCTEVKEFTAKKLDVAVEHKDGKGKVVMSFKSENAVLPEDVMPNVKDIVVDEETGKITEVFTFTSELVDDLSGEVVFSIDTTGVKNVVVTTVNAAGEKVEVETTMKGSMLSFTADLDGEYTFTFEEDDTQTGDAANAVVFAVVALMAVAGLVIVGKKRFAL